jgi:bidirectional [NiFe] hydrogenase diaphorase subunit
MASNKAVITLKINGIDISGIEGQSILEVAKESNIDIPTLCHVEGLSTVGSCRLCLVEIEGIPRLLPSCTTTISEGMNVKTESEKLLKYRQTVLSLMFSERNHICAVCVSNGHCDLQAMLQRLDMDHIKVPYLFPKVEMDATHDRFVLDHNRCILCSACNRVCAEIEGAFTKGVKDRGINTRIINDFDDKWGEAPSCTSCGKCVQVCPTGALFEKGKAVAEQLKRDSFIEYIRAMRAPSE